MRILSRLVLLLVVVTAPVALLASAAEKAQPEADWTKLFAKAAWYKDAEGKEQIFKGKLEAIPKKDGFSTLQRTSYYKLGERTIYTTAKKVAVLDKLVGKQVEIRGKAVDMELEGRALKEIWPAAVRPAAMQPNKDG